VHRFSADWFSKNVSTWKQVLGELRLTPKKILEIGSYEGRSATWMIENLLSRDGGEIFCIDAWDGIAHIESTFDHNTEVSLRRVNAVVMRKCKGQSAHVLASLLSSGHADSFDVVYVDGSHDAADVLLDLTLGFSLCRNGGMMICDDYLWNFGSDLCSTPKIAIDAFINCNARSVRILSAPLYQVFLIKMSPTAPSCDVSSENGGFHRLTTGV
jgi:cephalosporin hydroxylase